MVDKDEFFREATLRICSSLQIDIALERVFEYLREFVPLNLLFFSISDISLGALRLIASANDGSITVRKELFSPPKDIWQWGLGLRRPCIISHSDQDPSIRAVAKFIKQEGVSGLLLPLHIEDDRIGQLSLRAIGEGRYTQDHVELLSVLVKPFAIALANALDHEAVLKQRNILIDDNRFLNREILTYAGDEIVGGNSGLRNVMEMVQRVGPLNTTVLLLGETGTGKELIANAIHSASLRKEGPFIKLNCGAIAENLIDDELFGHEKGAFTGAVAEKRGRFERASGGTFFLDEIGELHLQSQVRLLRVLQSRMISRVGGEKPIPVDVRIIAATNRDLMQMVSEKKFREDLWFRLNIFPITVPPLRQRKEDIPALIRHFVMKKSRELGIAPPPPIAPSALERLMNYHWAGNVRELENLVERELIWYQGGELRFDSNPPDKNDDKTVSIPQGPVGDPLILDEAMRLHFNKVLKTTKDKIYDPNLVAELLGIIADSLVPDDRDGKTVPVQEKAVGDPLNLDEAMSLHITRVLKITKGKISGPGGAAELLGIPPNTLRARMNRLGILHGKTEITKPGRTLNFSPV